MFAEKGAEKLSGYRHFRFGLEKVRSYQGIGTWQ